MYKIVKNAWLKNRFIEHHAMGFFHVEVKSFRNARTGSAPQTEIYHNLPTNRNLCSRPN